MKSVIDHLAIVSTTAHDMIHYLAKISSALGDQAAITSTRAELFRALAKYCSEEANAAERFLPQLLRVQRENQELERQEQQEQQELQQQPERSDDEPL
jgi:hypothetical protein